MNLFPMFKRGLKFERRGTSKARVSLDQIRSWLLVQPTHRLLSLGFSTRRKILASSEQQKQLRAGGLGVREPGSGPGPTGCVSCMIFSSLSLCVIGVLDWMVLEAPSSSKASVERF